MTLLIIYFIIAVAVSFVCSILESVILTLTFTDVENKKSTNKKVYKILKNQKQDISTSISAILIINTIAHTVGATGVGSQAAQVFGSNNITIISVVLTLSILFFSEIIPKTIGTTYYRQLANPTAYLIKWLIALTSPMLFVTKIVTAKIASKKKSANHLTKEEILTNIYISEDQGAINEFESDVIENILKLKETKISELTTPRSIVFAVNSTDTIRKVLKNKDVLRYSRIPVFEETMDDIKGVVLVKDLLKHSIKKDTLVKISEITKPIIRVHKKVPVSKALDMFIQKREHMFLVIDSYDQTEGIITLEDCIEYVLGREIMDESDRYEDMQKVAKKKNSNK
jgi:CBS domain containing-hemolysin-like protein